MSEFTFPKLLELMQGKILEDQVLGFVDLCGTKSFIKNFLKSANVQGHLSRLQTSFSSALLNVANDTNLQIIQASDGAFLVGSADDVLRSIVWVLCTTPSIFDYKNYAPIPMRGSISCGLVQVAENQQTIEKIKNFKGYPYWGPAFVKTHLMEKFGEKGINIFITEAAKNKLSKSYSEAVLTENHKSVDVYGEAQENYYQVNWCDLMPSVMDDYIKSVLKEKYDPRSEYGIKALALFLKAAQDWSKTDDEYLKLYGENILKLRDT